MIFIQSDKKICGDIEYYRCNLVYYVYLINVSDKHSNYCNKTFTLEYNDKFVYKNLEIMEILPNHFLEDYLTLLLLILKNVY